MVCVILHHSYTIQTSEDTMEKNPHELTELQTETFILILSAPVASLEIPFRDQIQSEEIILGAHEHLPRWEIHWLPSSVMLDALSCTGSLLSSWCLCLPDPVAHKPIRCIKTLARMLEPTFRTS